MNFSIGRDSFVYPACVPLPSSPISQGRDRVTDIQAMIRVVEGFGKYILSGKVHHVVKYVIYDVPHSWGSSSMDI